MWNNVFENSEEKKEAPNDLIPYWMLGDGKNRKNNTILSI